MIVPVGSTQGLFLPRRRAGLGWRPSYGTGARHRGLGWRPFYGMGQVSPVGYADFNSFQNAVAASLPACPPPYDPACIGPRSAQISAELATWTSNPMSCHNVVCDASGNPAVSVQEYTTPAGTAAVGTGYNSVSGFVPTVQPVSPAAQPASISTASMVSPVFHPSSTGTAVVSPATAARPVPIQSASAATAPGGTLASSAAPTPVVTQSPPSGITPEFCAANQTYIPPGGTFSSGPSTGQVTSTGACQDNPTVTSVLSSIPLWGWGVAAIAAIFILRPGGKR